MAAETNGNYAVVWPRGEKSMEITPLAGRHESLDGKTIGFVWDYLFRGDEIFSILMEGLAERYPGVKFIDYSEFGSTHGGDEHAVIAALADKLKSQKADAVISGMGC